MSNGVNKVSVRRQAKALSEQVEELADRVRELTESVNQAHQNLARLTLANNERFQAIAGDIEALRDSVNAIVRATGLKDQVAEILKELRVERRRAQAAEEQAALEKGVVDGYVIPVEFVGTKSIIVGKYLDTEGKDVEPGRVQFVFPALEESFKQKLAGKAVGTEIEVEGGKFVVVGIYDVDVKKMQELRLKLQAAAASDAAAKAKAADAGEEQKVN